MAEPIRIVGHQNKDGTTNEGLQAQVEIDGSLRTNILTKYKFSDMDESGDPAYYGFVDADGNWYILQLNSASGAARYCKGSSGYTIAFASASGQSYDYFYNVF